MNKQQYRGTKLVSIIVNGVTMKIDPSSIGKDKRTVLHGKYKSEQVNSPALCTVGESAIFWPDANKPFAVAMRKADLGMLSTEFLAAEGFNVTPAAPR